MGKKALLPTLGDFTNKDNWDKFFALRGPDDAFEWYAEWDELSLQLLPLLSQSQNPHILVPGCGNSLLSEHLYDAGFRSITNIDFSKVAISGMLRRNVRHRPDMRWRVMDMTSMQFIDGTFDAVLDKGGLDALMEPEVGTKLGNQYLSEVKRVVKSGGKFFCLTLAESHVLALLFSKFRFGWKLNVASIPQKPSSKPNFQTFIVVAEKDESSIIYQILSNFNHSPVSCNGNQTYGLHKAIENENRIREEFANGADLSYSLEDLELGAKGDLKILQQGHRFKLIFGGRGDSLFSYRAVLLDAREHFGPFSYQYGVFIVPKARAHEWLFSSEEGQWMVVESSKSARLVMVFLDKSHSNSSMDIIQKDLSPLVKQLAPGKDVMEAQIPFMMASDGIKRRNIIHQATSSLTGQIVVEDVVYENSSGDASCLFPSEELIFRRLMFQRTEGLVQSEALLIKEGTSENLDDETRREKNSSSSKYKNRGGQRQTGVIDKEQSDHLKVYHDYLASSYHTAIISGFMLISSFMESVALSGKAVNAVVIGLGAGLLPMFLHACMSFLHIEVVELDPTIFTLARDYFGFSEDEHLKVHIANGIQFVRALNSSEKTENGLALPLSDGNCDSLSTVGRGTTNIGILIIDVDSSDSSSGMTCPAADFVEESFLQTVKNTLSEQGLFIVNLVTRSPVINDMVVSRMKAVFGQLYGLQLEEDVNEVLFALPSESCENDGSFSQASLQLERLLELKHPEINLSIMEATKKIRCLK